MTKMTTTDPGRPKHMAVFTLVVEYDIPMTDDGIGFKVMPGASPSDFHPQAVEHILDEMETAFDRALQTILKHGGPLSRSQPARSHGEQVDPETIETK
jgi:hypothetical protein